MTEKFCVIERDPLAGITPTQTYYATTEEAVAYGAPRVAFFGTVELLEVKRRFHTIMAPQTIEEPVE